MLTFYGLNQYCCCSHILRDLLFEPPSAMSTTLLDRHGVGKTKLLRTMMGLWLPSEA